MEGYFVVSHSLRITWDDFEEQDNHWRGEGDEEETFFMSTNELNFVSVVCFASQCL